MSGWASMYGPPDLGSPYMFCSVAAAFVGSTPPASISTPLTPLPSRAICCSMASMSSGQAKTRIELGPFDEMRRVDEAGNSACRSLANASALPLRSGMFSNDGGPMRMGLSLGSDGLSSWFSTMSLALAMISGGPVTRITFLTSSLAM